MDKNQIIEKFATNPEHKIMLSHIYDLALRRDDRNVLTASNFMSDNESALTESFLTFANFDFEPPTKCIERGSSLAMI